MGCRENGGRRVLGHLLRWRACCWSRPSGLVHSWWLGCLLRRSLWTRSGSAVHTCRLLS